MDNSTSPYLTKREGRRNWYIGYRPNDSARTRFKSTGVENKRDAEHLLNIFISENKNPKGPFIGQLLDKWVAEKPPIHLDTRKWFIEKLKEYWEFVKPEDVPAMMEGYKKGRRFREELSACLNYAERRKWIVRAPYVDLPPKMPPRNEWMSREQAQNLVLNAKLPHLRLFLIIALATGAREGAVLGLHKDRVDLANLIIDFNDPNLPMTKKKRSVVPIGAAIGEEIQRAIKFSKSGFVIEYNGKRIKKIRKSFNQNAEDCGLSWVTPHVTKHTAISFLCEKYSVDQVSDMTNTSANTVRRVYRHVNPNSLRPMASYMDNILLPNGQPLAN